MGHLTWNQGDDIYLDTDAVIYSVEKIRPYYELLLPLWSAAVTGDVRLIGSELLLLEFLVKPIREQYHLLENIFRQLLTDTEFVLLPITRSILEEAAHLRAITGVTTPDSIHAATAMAANCASFLSNDRAFLKFDGLPVRNLADMLKD